MIRPLLASTLSLGLLVACGGAPLPAPPPPPVPPAAPAAAAPAATPVPAPTVEGTWRGVLGGALHLVLTVQRSPDGLHALLDSVDQGAKLPVDVFTVEGGAVRFEIHRVKGSFEGKTNAAVTELQGTWTQNGPPQPLTFTKGEPPAETAATNEPPPRPLDAPVDVVVPQAPTAFRADGKTRLVYELHVTNFSHRPVTLRSVDVAARGGTLARLEGDALAGACEHPGAGPSEGAARRTIGPGLRAVVYMWVTLEPGPTPTALDHRIAVEVPGVPGELVLSNVRTPVLAGEAPVLAPPLHGGAWLAGNGPSNESDHRRALLPLGGRARIAQRFAIDWVEVGDGGRTFRGDPKKNESYLAYGAEALAVADGVVTETKDGIPQNVPGAEPVVPITLDTVAGNHVVVDVGRGHFAFWAHLQPGSLRVKVGDHVRRGQVLGLVGNSGNSTEPHLHFHVGDTGSPLGAEGVPYVLDAFELRPKDGPAVKRSKELPTQDEIVVFR